MQMVVTNRIPWAGNLFLQWCIVEKCMNVHVFFGADWISPLISPEAAIFRGAAWWWPLHYKTVLKELWVPAEFSDLWYPAELYVWRTIEKTFTTSLVVSSAVQILCLWTFVVRNQLTLQFKISDNKVKSKGTAQLWTLAITTIRACSYKARRNAYGR